MKRKLYKKLLQHLPKKEFTIVTGARQTGKSTLLHDLKSYCKGEGIPEVFINLENKTLLAELNDNPLNLLAYLPSQEKKTVVFLDEIQYLSDPSNFLKLIYDEFHDKVKIVASGSSAFYIDSKFKDSLAGRKRIFHLLTCDFEDYLMLQGKSNLWEEVIRIKEQPMAKSLKLDLLRLEWEAYMLFGGYPAVITETSIPEKKEMLKEIRDSFIKRDIVESGVQNEAVFYRLFQILASQTGQLVNVNELSNTLKSRNETIQNYLEVMEKCFHLTLIRPFYANIRKELVKMPKGFLLDQGLRNSLLNNFNPINQRFDKGELWEQAVFRLLADKFGLDGIRFWRTADGKEIDFVLPNENPPLAIEAKFDERLAKIKKYQLFINTYPGFNFQFATMQPWSEDFFRRFI
ncbi:MAG: ATP-binding protein [Mongoliibacter sp.]|uniref:ATP-binding protein n=1 Tax=Mongoliibacter sp. TaxID=2022438 RepID=UPI0012F18D6D|nr:ATP-binding protein [Mongoliibacter sp.]TVP42989.1 MAG: ATP-binding protein [Mongoliibacter sp.]